MRKRGQVVHSNERCFLVPTEPKHSSEEPSKEGFITLIHPVPIHEKRSQRCCVAVMTTVLKWPTCTTSIITIRSYRPFSFLSFPYSGACRLQKASIQ